MAERLKEDALAVLFRDARTYSKWLNKPVPDSLLRELYDLMKLGPTSMTARQHASFSSARRRPGSGSSRP